MRSISYTESRQKYAEVLDAAVDDHEEIEITRSGRESAVILALSEYESLKETAHLMRSPTNAARLRAAIGRIEHGEIHEHKLIDPDD